ncbi:hypothetical protein Tco_0495836 [Tanacetum coccineum]
MLLVMVVDILVLVIGIVVVTLSIIIPLSLVVVVVIVVIEVAIVVVAVMVVGVPKHTFPITSLWLEPWLDIVSPILKIGGLAYLTLSFSTHLLIKNTDSDLSNQWVNPTALSVPLKFMGSQFMNSLYEQPLTLGTAFIATAPTVGPATLGPPAPAASLALLEPSAVAAALVVSAATTALATSAALVAAVVPYAAIAASTLLAIIRSIAALLILFGDMILLITKDVGIIKKLYNGHDHDGK